LSSEIEGRIQDKGNLVRCEGQKRWFKIKENHLFFAHKVDRPTSPEITFFANQRVLNIRVRNFPQKGELKGLGNKHIGRIAYTSGRKSERKCDNKDGAPPDSRGDSERSGNE
jgi:hypothetical protein